MTPQLSVFNLTPAEFEIVRQGLTDCMILYGTQISATFY